MQTAEEKRIKNPYYGYGILYLSPNFHRWERTKGSWYREYRRAWAERAIRLDHGQFPLNLNVEVTTRCNLACTFCTHSSLSKEQVGDMSWELYAKVIKEAGHYKTPAVNFNGLGEPMLVRDLPKKIAYAKEHGFIDLMFHTNGTIMSASGARALIESGLDRIIFSIDSPDKTTYEAMRINADYERVIGNVRQFAELRNRLGRSEPIIRVTMVVTDKTVHQVQDFISLWTTVADQLTLQDLTWRTKLLDNSQWVNQEKSALTADFGAIRKEAIDREIGFACPYLYQSTYAFWNGDVIPCSNPNARKHMVMGQLDRNGLHEIWHNEKYRTLREMHAGDRWYEHPICRDCEIPLVELAKGLAAEGVTFDVNDQPGSERARVQAAPLDAHVAARLAPSGEQPDDLVLQFNRELTATNLSRTEDGRSIGD